MNHNEEMKMLGCLKKIADNTGRIADALEKMAESDISEGVRRHSCSTCVYEAFTVPCDSCVDFSRWEAKPLTFNHDPTGEPIGRVVNKEVVGDGLRFTIKKTEE